MILHILSASPFQHDALTRCLAVAQAGDSLLLTGDGVLALSNRERFFGADFFLPCFVLEPDRLARGMPATAQVTDVDHDGFVTLVARHDKSVSWF